jgi:thymidylate synthase (FAD)
MKILENFSKEYKEFSEKYPSIENEDIRYLLPNATPTNIIMTINARALLNLFQTRLCYHAQTEIRKLCEKMRELLKQEFFIFAMPEFDAKCQSLKRCPSGTNCRKI